MHNRFAASRNPCAGFDVDSIAECLVCAGPKHICTSLYPEMEGLASARVSLRARSVWKSKIEGTSDALRGVLSREKR